MSFLGYQIRPTGESHEPRPDNGGSPRQYHYHRGDNIGYPRPQLNEVDATFRHRIEGEPLPLQPAGRIHQAAPEYGETHVGSPVLVVFLVATGAANLCLLWSGTSECNSLVLAFVFYLHNGSLATIS